MKKTLILCIYLIPLWVFSQGFKQGEIGLVGAGTFYMGELNHIPFKGTMPAGGLLYRHTVDTRLALKGQIMAGILKGDGKRIDGIPTSFSQLFYDGSVSSEFNFIPFISAHKKYNFTPYAHAGLGMLYYNAPYAKKSFQLNIPFGFGAKFNINEDWSWGAEYSLKKTFTDYLDYSYEEITLSNVEYIKKQQAYAGNKDWVSYLSIYISHKIKYRMKCPAFD